MKAAAKRKPIIEEYMNNSHIEEFRAQLLQLQGECSAARQAIDLFSQDDERPSDDADRSDRHMRMEENRNALRRLAVQQNEIDAALRRIEDGEYGYCEESGDEIGLARLRANPLARLCIEAQVRQEHMGRLRA